MNHLKIIPSIVLIIVYCWVIIKLYTYLVDSILTSAIIR